MTAPVGQRASADGYVVSFTMPSSYALEALPDPDDRRIGLLPVECPDTR